MILLYKLKVFEFIKNTGKLKNLKIILRELKERSFFIYLEFLMEFFLFFKALEFY